MEFGQFQDTICLVAWPEWWQMTITATDNDYTHRGSIRRSYVMHVPSSGDAFVEEYINTFDGEERPLARNHVLTGRPAVNLETNTYDAIGRLLSVAKGGNIASLELGMGSYDVAPTVGWDMTYDGINRLTGIQGRRGGAIFAGETSSYTYDSMGNLLSKSNFTASGTDNITFNVPTDGNVLTGETYDANGNRTTETASGISSITYNTLNLPESVTVDTLTVHYLYSAAGTKLKESSTDYSGNYDFGARWYSPKMARWTTQDPLAEKYYSISPYAYCAGNPVNIVDPIGNAWKPTKNSMGNRSNGYEWISEDQSYDSNGNLKEGLYHQAIFFSNNGTYDSNSNYNIGSSTATVYLADGSITTFDACTLPSDTESYPTIPEGEYEAKVGIHRGKSGSYTALRMGDVGTSDFDNNRIELGEENPAFSDGRTYAEGANIHKSGLNGLTGFTSKNDPISAGCLTISRDSWSSFIGIFNSSEQKDNTIGVTVSRTFSAPENKNIPKLPSVQSPKNWKYIR